MASRLKLTVAYDGSSFSGWQSQPNGNGIQDYLEKAFAQISGADIRVHGAGRTDAGVHALAQCAHADLPVRRYRADRWRSALNGVLPATIRIMRCGFVADSFHARFSAKAKVYRYRIWNSEVLPPLEQNRAWHVREPLNLVSMAGTAKIFLGRHDFASFSANRGAPVTETIRHLRRIRLRRTAALISIEMEGDGFLYKMARMIVGSLVQNGLGEASLNEVRSRLEPGGARFSVARRVAPAAGLFLVRVRY